jgi:hypothetical protein
MGHNNVNFWDRRSWYWVIIRWTMRQNRSLFGNWKVILVYIRRWSYGRFRDANKVFKNMKNDLTTGTWQDNIWCPRNIILLCTSDEWTCEGGARFVVDQSARQGTYNDGIDVGVVKAKGLLLQCWHQRQREQEEGIYWRQVLYIGGNGKEIGLWWQGQCVCDNCACKARARGRLRQTRPGKARVMQWWRHYRGNKEERENG